MHCWSYGREGVKEIHTAWSYGREGVKEIHTAWSYGREGVKEFILHVVMVEKGLPLYRAMEQSD